MNDNARSVGVVSLKNDQDSRLEDCGWLHAIENRNQSAPQG